MSKKDPGHQGSHDANLDHGDEHEDTERGEHPEGVSWRRSFPPGTIEGNDWMIDVLDDLQAYASTHNLDEIADTLAETRRLVFAHLAATRH